MIKARPLSTGFVRNVRKRIKNEKIWKTYTKCDASLRLFYILQGKTQAKSNKVNILCTIFPQYDWTRSILGNADNFTNLSLLVKSGVDLHNYQPSTADIVQISTCDLLIYVGGESDAWLKDALANATNKNMKVISLMDVLKDSLKEEEFIEGMQEETECEEDSDSETEYDEHVWLSVKNAKILCNEIADSICSLVPENAETYKENLQAYLEELNNLDMTYASVIKNSPRKTILVCDRFPLRYLTDDYKLNYYAAFAGCSAETEASFETIAFLSNKLKEEKMPAVLVLDQSDEKIAKTVILNAKLPKTDILKIDSMQSTTLRQSFNGKTYISTMQENLEALQKALK